MARYQIQDKPLICVLCQHDDFHWHEGLKESRAATFFGFDWAKQGVDKLTCNNCSHTLSFARTGAANRPKCTDEESEALGAPGF